MIGVLVPRPAAFDANYKIAQAAPLPIIRAYGASGQLLKKVDAPHIG